MGEALSHNGMILRGGLETGAITIIFSNILVKTVLTVIGASTVSSLITYYLYRNNILDI